MTSASPSSSGVARGSSSSHASDGAATASAPPPQTPSTVPDLHPALCRDLIQFRHFLAKYRALDDRITSLLNRTLATSRESGRNQPPSLLLPLPLSNPDSPLLLHARNNTPAHFADAGVSTYARADPTSCATLWDQLVRVWTGREDSVRYCLEVTQAQAGNRLTYTTGPASPPGRGRGAGEPDELASLDADRSRPSDVSAAEEGGGRRARKTKDRDAERAPERWRGDEDEDAWRGKREVEEDALARQLHNELRIDQILRRRSIEVFRSRCPSFHPPDPSQTPVADKGTSHTPSDSQQLLQRSWQYWNEK
ncbi:unnamed protein product [Tilletia controversa]|nr:hypothetical protein CF336_g6941 [Tilletia laevis]KAE8199154.1 hypothetical protein CF328_g3335 [Tilletia controversa]CAD6885732.1 unnamed protein product [Tilletia caries]CAD6920104.1 unnamed protein product [Tilletia controversa]CAD6920308.1 unnamed protein product [Tilletia controversa]